MNARYVMQLIIGVAFLGAAALSNSVSAKPVVEWKPPKLVQDVYAGSASDTTVTIVFSKSYASVDIRVVPELAGYISVLPAQLLDVVAGVPIDIDIAINLPSGLEPRILQGVIQLRESSADDTGKGGTIARPLPVILNVSSAPSALVTVRAIDEVGKFPADVSVYFDEVEVGSTDEQGSYTAETDPGIIKVGVSDGLSGGVEFVDLDIGEHEIVEIALKSEGMAALKEHELALAELVDGALGTEFESFSLRFVNMDGDIVPVNYLDYAVVQPAEDEGIGEEVSDLTEHLAVNADGTISAVDVEAIRATLLALTPDILLTVHGEDADGFVFGGTIEIWVGS